MQLDPHLVRIGIEGWRFTFLGNVVASEQITLAGRGHETEPNSVFICSDIRKMMPRGSEPVQLSTIH
jgi:hypothetical protein